MELKDEILWMLIKKASCQNLLTFRFGLLTCKALVSPASFLTVRDYTEWLRTYQQAEPRARRYREAMKVFLNEAYPLDKVHPLDRMMIDPVLRQMTIEFDAIPKFEDRLPWGQETISGMWWDVSALILINLGLFVIAYVAFRRYDVR